MGYTSSVIYWYNIFMRKITFLLIGFLSVFTAQSYGAVIAPQTPPVPDDTSTSPSKVHGLTANTRSDGPELPDINGTLSLQDCIDLALANSPVMVSAQLAAQNARVNLNLAKSQFLPTVSAGFDSRYNMGTPVHDYGTSNTYATANLTLSGLTDLVRNVKMKQSAVEQADLNVQSVQNDIVRNVRKGYYTLLSAQRAVAIRTQSRDVYKDQYERTAEYYRLGLRPKVDVTTAEVNLNNESLSLIRATNAVKTASASLANILGVTTPNLLTVQMTEDFETWDISLEEAVKNAYNNRPDVQSAHLEVRIGQMQLSQARSGVFPTMTLSAGYTKSGESLYLDTEAAHVGVGIEIPIFNAFKTYNSVKQAKIALENTHNSTRSLLNNVYLEVQKAYIQLNEAAESIPLAKLNAEKAKENLELAQGRYNEGIGDMISLKDAEVAYTDAELSLLTARYDYASAVADLKQAMGTY